MIRHNHVQPSRRHLPAASALLLLFVLLTPPARASDGSEPVVRHLPNGMTVILRENHAAPVVSIQAWVNTGSTREGPGEEGIAHMLEHMFFKGTESRGVGEIASEVEASGGHINAYTSWDQTVYFINIASSFMDKGIDILADVLQSATFDADEMEKEKLVVLEEVRRSDDMPARKLGKAFFREAYAVHPYGRPVIGYEETVQEFTRDTLVNFYRRWYVPENIVWVMAGDFDIDKTLPLLERRLSQLPRRPVPVRVEVREPPQTAPSIFVMHEDTQQAHVEIGFHIPGIADPDVPALDLLAQVLGHGESSRLYSAFRRKDRVVHSIGAYSMTPRDPGLFTVSATLDANDVERVLPKIINMVLDSGFTPVTPEELNSSRTQIESDFIYQQETVQGQARELGFYMFMAGSLDFGERYLEEIRGVRAEDLQSVARTYLRPENMTVGIMLPNTDSKPLKTNKILKNICKDYARLTSKQAREESSSQGNAARKILLANGATLIIKRNPAVPIVSMNAAFLGGLLSEDRETDGIGNFTARMLTKGTTTRTAEQISREIEAMAGSVSGYSGRNSLGLSSQVLSEHFPAAFEIFTDVLLHPEFPEEYVEKTRKDILAAIKSQQDSLMRVSINLFWETLYPCHPYGMNILGTPKTIERLGRPELRAYYAREAVASNLVLAVVGDVDVDETRKMVEEALAPMPRAAAPFELPEIKCNEVPERKAEEVVSPDKLQAHILLGARGTSLGNRDRYVLDVLETVLSSQGGRLFMELRDRQSLAYTVTAFNTPAYEPGAFAVYIATQPENCHKAIEGIRKELQKIREKKVSPEELERAKNYLIGSQALTIQTNSSQAWLMALYQRYGLGYDDYLSYPDHIRKVTADQVRKAARKYLSPERLVEVAVVPGQKEKPLQ